MASLGTLTLDNKKYNLLEFNYNSNQQIDKLGKPLGKPSGSIIDLTIESDRDSSVLKWMLDDEEKDGVITFYKQDAMS